jgi:catechol 2,3-dioxygenase-like lactoylglutathione lyase family enzyme
VSFWSSPFLGSSRHREARGGGNGVAIHSDRLQFYAVRLLVKDFERSWRFYRDVLGLTPMKGHGHPPYGEFVWKGHAQVAIFDRSMMAEAVGLDPGRYPPGCVGKSAVVFEVKDVDALAQRLRQQGVRLLQGPTDRPDWRLRTIHLRDPDGYLVEVYSPLPS